MNFQPGTTDEQRTNAHVFSFSQRLQQTHVEPTPTVKAASTPLPQKYRTFHFILKNIT
ncbi:MAG TPA: hypothetical protein VMU83_06665 [Hanamia sp.]|nr:hypothetical protein [Hanamia sp.]